MKLIIAPASWGVEDAAPPLHAHGKKANSTKVPAWRRGRGCLYAGLEDLVLGDGGVHRARGTFDPLNGLLGALAYAGTTAIALGVVDDSHVVLEEDGLIRAVAHAQAAGNAADLAGLVDHSALILAAALNSGLRGDGLHLDNLARADSRAGGTTGALFAVDHGHAVDDMDGIKLTCLLYTSPSPRDTR